MKLLGTILEWMDHDPEAHITNRKFLQEHVSLYDIRRLLAPEKFRYPCRLNAQQLHYVDTDNFHTTPHIHFGSSAPYMVSGEFEYTGGVCFWVSGAGTTFPLSTEMLNDPEWEEYAPKS